MQNHSEVGSGLGLSIVHQAVQHLGGTINFSRSVQLGGLHVEIQFPLSPTASPEFK